MWNKSTSSGEWKKGLLQTTNDKGKCKRVIVSDFGLVITGTKGGMELVEVEIDFNVLESSLQGGQPVR